MLDEELDRVGHLLLLADANLEYTGHWKAAAVSIGRS